MVSKSCTYLATDSAPTDPSVPTKPSAIIVSNLIDFPDEILLHIFDYLNFSSLTKTALVNKRFFIICIDDKMKLKTFNNLYIHLCDYLKKQITPIIKPKDIYAFEKIHNIFFKNSLPFVTVSQSDQSKNPRNDETIDWIFPPVTNQASIIQKYKVERGNDRLFITDSFKTSDNIEKHSLEEIEIRVIIAAVNYINAYYAQTRSKKAEALDYELTKSLTQLTLAETLIGRIRKLFPNIFNS